jgi:putative Mg2+ transporter-C (MgtC) family protein
MDALWQELNGGMANFDMVVRVSFRMILATLCGAFIGWERWRSGQAAGLRTHMLVSLGACLFALIILESTPSKADVSRVIQGIVTGVGFLGAGTILKGDSIHPARGLTTAADIWVMAAVGTAVAAGYHFMALLGTVLTWVILYYLHGVEHPQVASGAAQPGQPSQQQTQ